MWLLLRHPQPSTSRMAAPPSPRRSASTHTALRSLRLDSKIDRRNSKCITLRMLMRYYYPQISRVVSRRRSTAERQIPMCSDEQMLPPRLSSGLHRGAPVTPTQRLPPMVRGGGLHSCKLGPWRTAAREPSALPLRRYD
jgi:hypothetical protein